MKSGQDRSTAGLHRVAALLKWWGFPGDGVNREIDAQLVGFGQFTSDLQQAYGDTCSREFEAGVSANERLAQSFHRLAHSRHAQELLATESEVLATLLDAAALQAEIWTELTARLREASVSMALAAAHDVRRQDHASRSTSLSHGKEQRTRRAPLVEREYAH